LGYKGILLLPLLPGLVVVVVVGRIGVESALRTTEWGNEEEEGLFL